jgi:multidrug efflux pump
VKDFSRFFVDRPIFAAVISILILTAGLIALPLLPITEYPDVVPPTVQVRAVYPGANPKVIAETVATPLEEAINGVENMMYMKSVAGSDGVMYLTVTFKPGTDVDLAQVQVQNRVGQATARLPEDVRRLGVTTEKQSPNLTMVVHLISPKQTYDALYLRNYATLHVKDELARIPGVGMAMIFGGGDYSMRVWLDPDKVAARGLTAGDVVRAIQEQNVQVSAGQIGAPPQPVASDFTLSINAQGGWSPRTSSATSSSRPAPAASSPACATWRGSSWAPRTTRCAPCSTTVRRWRSSSSRRPARTRSSCRTTSAPAWAS